MKDKMAWVLFTLVSILATSCLKDKDYDNGIIQSVHGGDITVIGFGLNVATANQFLDYQYNPGTKDTTIELVPVILNTAATASEDIHVSVTRTDSLLDGYNKRTDSGFVSSEKIRIVGDGVVTIPKGSNTGFLSLTFNPSSILNEKVALGLTITNIKESGYVISGNTQKGIVAFREKKEKKK